MKLPDTLHLSQRHAPGDAVVMTAGVRDLKALAPSTQIYITSPHEDVWRHNPYIAGINVRYALPKPVDVTYKTHLDRAWITPGHYISSCHRFLEDLLRVRVPVRAFKPDIHLSADELAAPHPFGGEPYWIVVAGGKSDMTTKMWLPEYMQAVIDHFTDRRFVQLGSTGMKDGKITYYNFPLRNVIDLVGKTSLRKCIQLMHHAAGVICPVTMMMHLAAGVPRPEGVRGLRPCVVIAGGREPAHWEQYPGHQFLQTIGQLSCCAERACFARRTVELPDGHSRWNAQLCAQPVAVPESALKVAPRCQQLITPEAVIRAVRGYDDVVAKLPVLR